jgi:hypothetical protein
MTPAHVPISSAVSGGNKIVKWLWETRQAHDETSKVIRQALRTSICRYDPFAPGVDDLAKGIEAAMWEVASRADDNEGPFRRFVRRVRAIPGRQASKQALDFPNWHEDVRNWVGAAVRQIPLADWQPKISCQGFPTDAESLIERFPYMFHLEAENPRRSSALRRDLADRLGHAEDRRTGASHAFTANPQGWVTSTTAALAAAAGLTVADIAQWSDRGLVAGASGLIGGRDRGPSPCSPTQ